MLYLGLWFWNRFWRFNWLLPWNFRRIHDETLINIVNASVERVERIKPLPLIKKLVQDLIGSYNKWIFRSFLQRISQKYFWSNARKPSNKHKVDWNLVLFLCSLVLYNKRSVHMSKLWWRSCLPIREILGINRKSLVLLQEILDLRSNIFLERPIFAFRQGFFNLLTQWVSTPS